MVENKKGIEDGNANNPLMTTSSLGRFERVSYSSIPQPIRRNEVIDISRQPIEYRSHPASPLLNQSPAFNRFKYYSKLENHNIVPKAKFEIPNHILPSDLFLVKSILSAPQEDQDESHGGKQSSIVTIFSIWNTMIGTSLLTMPWAIQQAGFGLGVFLILMMCGVCLYTCNMVNRLGTLHDFVRAKLDWSDIIGLYLGIPAEQTNTIFSIITLVGACITYWVLMSNFLFHSGLEIFDIANSRLENKKSEIFHHVWTLKYCCFYILPVLFLLSSMKNMSFFAKFNALGILSIAYMLVFSIAHLSENGSTAFKIPNDPNSTLVSWTFFELTGVLMQSFFIHNSILAIVRNNHDQSKNTRDTSIAYILTCVCYLTVGICFWLSYKGDRSTMPSNLLDFFEDSNHWAFFARIFLLFQMFTVFPLICYIIRIQAMMLFRIEKIKLSGILLINAIICGTGLLFGLFYTNVGNILRFAGAFTGSVIMFALPCSTWICYQRDRDRFSWKSLVFHAILVVLVFMNFFAQFIKL